MLKLRNLPDGSTAVTIEFDGSAITVPSGTTVAAAVLSAGSTHTRLSPVNGTPRAPYCLMGVCFECLMEIDGRANQRACQTTVESGMRIRRQNGKRDL